MKNTAIKVQNDIIHLNLNDDFINAFSLNVDIIRSFFSSSQFLNDICILLENNDFSCKSIFNICKKLFMNKKNNILNTDEYLFKIYNIALSKSFPNSCEINIHNISNDITINAHIYLNVLRVFCIAEKNSKVNTIQSQYPLNFLSKAEIKKLEDASEYISFMNAFENDYIYEMMKLNQELLKYNTLDHICMLHSLGMHISKQLKKLNMHIDLSRISGACAGHDIGKFGCRSNESNRVPYLHYYYTDEWFKNHNIVYIGNISVNHSVWDLELENLSLESLILIYCDFRTKNIFIDDIPHMKIFSLTDSFDVILKKLDNVDDTKKRRYENVYLKLKDFENYLLSLNIDVNLSSKTHKPKPINTYYSILGKNEITNAIKNLSIYHNTKLMHKLRDESSLNFILESALNEDDSDNVREYIDIFKEYSTYLTENQKIITLKFLYEQLTHPQEDIRKQCANTMGTLIANFDNTYRKELPTDVILEKPQISSLSLFKKYINLFLNPDHKVTEIHKKWIGYNLSTMIKSLFNSLKYENLTEYKSILKEFYEIKYDLSSNYLYLITTCEYIPLINLEDDIIFYDFVLDMLNSPNSNLHIPALNMSYIFLNNNYIDSYFIGKLKAFFEKKLVYSNLLAQSFLNLKIVNLLGLDDGIKSQYENIYLKNTDKLNVLFLNNLKTSTPWVVKKINIDLLLQTSIESNANTLYTAMHFCNVLKVSAIEGVRNHAGKSLIKLVSHLSNEQKNDIAVELLRSLEIEGYQYSKYIPYYLGQIISMLDNTELNEIVDDIMEKIKKSSYRISSLLLKTIGVLIQYSYKNHNTLNNILSILLIALSHYDYKIKQFSFKIIGKYIFGCDYIILDEKFHIFDLICKKTVTMLDCIQEKDLLFLTNVYSLNYIYKFICECHMNKDSFNFTENDKIAFFPGTFDPFSLSHKEIVKTIQNMGFDVYLAIDEFSWSKKTQPNLLRREIANMSISDELNIHIFPQDFAINISNPKDILHLQNIFKNKEIYLVVGSDVVINASAYKKDFIYSLNHIIFERHIIDYSESIDKIYSYTKNMKKECIRLNLKPQYEDISSTQIREYINNNKDISNLIDTLAQQYIYEKGLYQRENQYKILAQSTDISIYFSGDKTFILNALKNHISSSELKNLSTKDLFMLQIHKDNEFGFCVFHNLDWRNIQNEFKNSNLSDAVRKIAHSKTTIIDLFFANNEFQQTLLTEVISCIIDKDSSYILYKKPKIDKCENLINLLKLYGFIQLNEEFNDVFLVNVTNPCVLTLDSHINLKSPFKENDKVQDALSICTQRLQNSLTSLYPGNLLLSFNTNMLYSKLINKICLENNVSNKELKVKKLGNAMCVPFGNILKSYTVPNTVTKSLHTEKTFAPHMNSFDINAFPYYLELENQIKTISSFDRPIILVDDVLNKGYRINALSPKLKKENVKIQKIIVGILSSKGKELMDMQKLDVDYIYFIPSLKFWFNENTLYPFIGGDSLWRGFPKRNLINSINFILPYTSPFFIKDASSKSIFNLSTTCIENTILILETLEKEYEKIRGRKLTLNRLGEVFLNPRCPDRGYDINYNLNLTASYYLKSDLELLNRIMYSITH